MTAETIEATDIDPRINMFLHPGYVKNIEGYYDADITPFLAPTETAFSAAYEGIRATWTAKEAAAKNPTWNEAQQIIQTDDYAQKQFARIAKSFDSVRGNLVKSIASIEGELSRPVESRASSQIAEEVRRHAKGLGTDARMNFIRKAIDEGDHVTASSVLGAPPYLSGFDAGMQKVLLRYYHEKHQPHLSRRLKAMQAAQSLIEERAGLVFGELEKAVGAPPHKAKALREAKTAAEKHFVMSGN